MNFLTARRGFFLTSAVLAIWLLVRLITADSFTQGAFGDTVIALAMVASFALYFRSLHLYQQKRDLRSIENFAHRLPLGKGNHSSR